LEKPTHCECLLQAHAMLDNVSPMPKSNQQMLTNWQQIRDREKARVGQREKKNRLWYEQKRNEEHNLAEV